MAQTLIVRIIGDAKQLEASLAKAGASTEAAGSRFQRLGRVAGVAGLAVGAGLAVALEKSVKAALAAQQSQARLEQSFKDAGLALSDYTSQVDTAESASRKLGFTDTEVRGALGSLVVATGSVSASMRDLSVAEDLARFKHIGLTDASKMMTMAMTGSQRAAKQLGIIVIPTTAAVDALKRSHVDLASAAGKAELAHAKLVDKMATGQAVIDQVAAKTRGQGEAFAATAAGGMARFQASLDHLMVTIGTQLLPALTILANKAAGLAETLNTQLGPVIRQTTVALGHLGFAADAAAFVFKYSANIYNVVKVELYALGVAIRAATAVMNALRSAASSVAAAFSGAMHAAVSAVTSGVNAIVAAFHRVIATIRGLVGSALSAGAAIGSAIMHGIASGITGAIGSAIGAVKGGIGSVLNAARSFAHIKSPSGLFAEQVGAPISQGIALGITQDGWKVANAAVKTVQTATTAAAGWAMVGGRKVGQAFAAAIGAAVSIQLPLAMQIALAQAELVGDVGAQINALQAEAIYLARLASTLNPQSQAYLDAITALMGVNTQIQGLIANPPSPSGLAAVPSVAASTGPTVVVNIAGSVTSEQDLVTAVHAGLLQKQKRNGNLGFAT